MSFARLISPLMLQNSIETPLPFHTLLSKQSRNDCHQIFFSNFFQLPNMGTYDKEIVDFAL